MRSIVAEGAVDHGARRALTAIIEQLRLRGAELTDAAEQHHFFSCAESLEVLCDSPSARRTLDQPRIARELSSHLHRYLTVRRALRRSDPSYGDVFLRAAVTAVHMALGLGHWRANPNVPVELQALLNADDVYSSILKVEKLRRSAELDEYIQKYSAVVRALNEDGHGETGIKVRNSVLWMWCKFNINNVAYRFRDGGSRRNWEDFGDERLYDAVADAKVMLVIFNVLLDDVADNLQDPELLAILSAIPTVGGEFRVAPRAAYAKLRERLFAVGRERFAAYFDLAAEIWQSALLGIEELTGDGFEDWRGQLAEDNRSLLLSMRLSVDMNRRPRELFAARPDELARRYGGSSLGEVLAHNANLSAFLTIDLMVLRNMDPALHDQIVLSGAVDTYRQAVLISQDMQQMGNSVATGAREIGSDDLSNDLFKVANDLLNARDDWELPEHLLAAGIERRDAMLSAFERKKTLRQLFRDPAVDPDERDRARAEYGALGDDIKLLFERSGAERSYFGRWLARRRELGALLEHANHYVDCSQIKRSDDLMLLMHLIYKGRI
jgi:hypothetical protein